MQLFAVPFLVIFRTSVIFFLFKICYYNASILSIEERLIEMGVDSSKAANLSNYIAKSLTGQKLKRNESEAIRDSKQAQRVIIEYNEQFTSNVSSEWVNGLNKRLSEQSKTAKNASTEADSQAKKLSTDKPNSLNIKADTHDIRVSENGNTVVTETGEAVNITGIESVRDAFYQRVVPGTV